MLRRACSNLLADEGGGEKAGAASSWSPLLVVARGGAVPATNHKDKNRGRFLVPPGAAWAWLLVVAAAVSTRVASSLSTTGACMLACSSVPAAC